MEELFPRNGCNYQVENVFQKKKEKKRKEKENRKNCFEKSAVEEGVGGG